MADFVIENSSVQADLNKWDGSETTACDRLFLEEFSAGLVSEKTLRQFSATNTVQKRTGGYSIGRTFWGGIFHWATRIDIFVKEDVAMYRMEYQQSGNPDIAYKILDELANMEGAGPSGKKRKLGTVSASKLAFFLCPEMPFFIYDSVVGKVFGRKSAPRPNEYPMWCAALEKLLPDSHSFREQVPEKRRPEFANRLDWLARRSLDLALYANGEKI
ncbi:MAG: hypothetical protein M1309_05895 [Actinobacteria bacterium]|nr:hypothetical protein [Actinomycetota bacterium]